MRVWGQILVFNTMSRLSNWRCEKFFVEEGETNLMDKTGVNIHIGEKNMKISNIERMGPNIGILLYVPYIPI